ncbi:Wound-responsive family protein [Euphorbia peplus]|nr:Wound-responsive family protein [Euphorbia peplus]
MGSRSGKAWMVAASIGAVEALKDHGFCRWNYSLRSIHQHAKNISLRSSSSSMVSSSSTSSNNQVREESSRKAKEESLRTVMFLSCWGPNN